MKLFVLSFVSVIVVAAAASDIENGNTKDSDSNQYYLYTRQNSLLPQKIELKESSIKSSNFDSSLETVVVVHGWMGGLNLEMNVLIRDAYLKKKSVNIIILDWNSVARLPYPMSVSKVPEIGRNLGKFLAFITNTTGASLNNMHLVGHSLGAHIVGIAGRNVGGKLARITGLDPAGPLWSNHPERLTSTDAEYVEAIHTDGGLVGSYGIGQAIARVNFYPNGGSAQTGCFNNVCNHDRSWRLFAASITFDKFVGKQCSTQTQMMLGLCRGSELNMGNDQLHKTGGLRYYLQTTAGYPYFK